MSKFQLDVSEVMGFDYETFISHQKSLAISNPKQFYTERNEALKKLKVAIIKDIYEKLFKALHEGDIAGMTAPTFKSIQLPHYPPQLINDTVLHICKGVSNDLTEVVNLLYPDDYQKIADAKATLNTKGNAGISTDLGKSVVDNIANNI